MQNKKRVLVTGGSGFLGQHLLRALLAAGHSVHNIDLQPNDEFPTTVADIRDAEKMLALIKDVDAVFHLASLIQAGESVQKPRLYLDTNMIGSLNILEAMRVNQVPTFIFSSSAAIYGEPQRTPIHEDDRTLPINPYGVTKLAMEGLLNSYVASHGMTGVALRYFNLYGSGENHVPETHAIPRFISQIKSGAEVTVWGDGGHQRDYVYITDIVTAHLQALELAEKQPNQYHYFNLSAEQPTSVSEIISLLEKEIGMQANIKHFPDRPGDPRVLVADATKAHEQLDWRAETSIDVGLAETVKYFTQHPLAIEQK